MATQKKSAVTESQTIQDKTAQHKHEALVALGQQIRKVREKQSISQENFAAQAGIARSYYGGIERGERNVAALNLMRIAAALQVEVGELFPPTSSLTTLLDPSDQHPSNQNQSDQE